MIELLDLAYLTLGYESKLLLKRFRPSKYLPVIFTFIIHVCSGFVQPIIEFAEEFTIKIFIRDFQRIYVKAFVQQFSIEPLTLNSSLFSVRHNKSLDKSFTINGNLEFGKKHSVWSPVAHLDGRLIFFLLEKGIQLNTFTSVFWFENLNSLLLFDD